MSTSIPTTSADRGARKRIVVAMSGGVNSSVAAALMQGDGHDVIGITLQLYDHGEATGRKGSCCSPAKTFTMRAASRRLWRSRTTCSTTRAALPSR